jgi:hypothetical protein
MTRLPPIVIPVDSPREVSLKPSFKPGSKDKSKDAGREKPPADLSTVDDSEHLDDDTITGKNYWYSGISVPNLMVNDIIAI